jgi:hypothetical protein
MSLSLLRSAELSSSVIACLLAGLLADDVGRSVRRRIELDSNDVDEFESSLETQDDVIEEFSSLSLDQQPAEFGDHDERNDSILSDIIEFSDGEAEIAQSDISTASEHENSELEASEMSAIIDIDLESEAEMDDEHQQQPQPLNLQRSSPMAPEEYYSESDENTDSDDMNVDGEDAAGQSQRDTDDDAANDDDDAGSLIQSLRDADVDVDDDAGSSIQSLRGTDNDGNASDGVYDSDGSDDSDDSDGSDGNDGVGLHYKISASAAGMNFRFDCDRQLRLSCMPREQRNEYSQYSTNGQKAVLQALFARGRDFENRMKALVVSHPTLRLTDLTKKNAATVNRKLIEYSNVSTVLCQAEFTMIPESDDSVEWLRHLTDAHCQLATLTPDFIFAHVAESGDYVDLIVVDAKSSSSLKTEHQVQISVYILGIREYIRVNRINEQRQQFNADFMPFRVSSTGGVWLPDSVVKWRTDEWELEHAPELTDLSVMIDKMAVFLGTHLPHTLVEPLENAEWILSDRCRTCDYVSNCRTGARGALDDTVPYEQRVPLITSVPYMQAADMKWCHDMVRVQQGEVHPNMSLLPLQDVEDLLHHNQLSRQQTTKLRKILDGDHVLLNVPAEDTGRFSHTARSAVMRAAHTGLATNVSFMLVYYSICSA